MDRTITRAFELFRDVAVSDQLPWWEWDFRTNKVTASPLKSHMLGYEPADFVDVGYEAFTGLIHPDDFEATMQAIRALLPRAHWRRRVAKSRRGFPQGVSRRRKSHSLP